MLTIIGHKIALDPTIAQANYFARACGVTRFTWNWALAKWKELYATGQKPNANSLSKLFNKIKRAEFPWIYETHKDANQRAFTNLRAAFEKFFNNTGAYPLFKRKGGSRDSCYFSNDTLEVDGKRVRLPIIGWIRMRETLRIAGKIMSATISRHAGKWFLSINVQTPVVRSIAEALDDGIVGVDLGISALATLSTGEVVEGPKPLKTALKKLRRANRSFDRKSNGSANKRKAAARVARIHARIGNIRNDALHKLTTRLCRENQTVVMEDLRMAFMLKNRHLARAASDIGMGEFQRQMKYKAPLFGTELIIANRFYPSTKMCSRCDAIYDIRLAERVYCCMSCGLILSRDHNAAINLKRLSTPGFGGIHACEQEGSGSPITEKRNHAWIKQEPAKCAEVS